MNEEYNAETLERCLFGSPPQRESDQVRITFDWEIPQQARAPIVFQVHVSRLGRESSIKFAIDLDRLQTSDLQALLDFLAFPPKGYWLARSIAWLLDLSLQQQQPALTGKIRCAKVRELSLSDWWGTS
jgi:hypothetical protein